MTSMKWFLAASLVALAFAPAAHADKSISTAAAPTGTSTMYCDATNIGTTPLDITYEILDVNGTTVTGPTVYTVPAGTGQFFQASNATAAWCRFTASSIKNVRGMAIYDNGTSYTMSLPAY